MVLTDLLNQAQSAGVVLFLDGDRIGVRGDPAVTAEWLPRLRPYRDEVLAALAARVIDSCKFCAHHRRPGIGNRYCGGRPDLPLAYGPGHPLRRLPADLGDSCQSFEVAEAYR